MNIQIGVLTICFLAGSGYGSPVQGSNNQCSATRLALSINDFGANLVRVLNENDNLFISPLSIYTALAMVYLGSGGQTAEQMETAFHLRSLGLQPAELHNSLRDLLQLIKEGNDEYSLLVANGLFVQQNFTLKQEYIADAQELYSAAVRLVDFLTRGEEAKDEINRWVEDKTNNKIQDFVQSPLQPSTKIALLNAVYFKGIWKTKFDSESTVDGSFGPSQRKVKYMILREEAFRFFEDPQTHYKYLELPYKGDNIKMLLTLPRNQDEPLNIEMDSATLCRINSSLTNTTLENVIIPRFKIKYRQDLKQSLIGLGIQDVFTSSANLSGIREQNDLLVSKVQHEAVLEVNEEGSEAAAVTGIYITRLSITFRPEFVANHPFYVHIIDSRNGVVLFAGQIVNP